MGAYDDAKRYLVESDQSISLEEASVRDILKYIKVLFDPDRIKKAWEKYLRVSGSPNTVKKRTVRQVITALKNARDDAQERQEQEGDEEKGESLSEAVLTEDLTNWLKKWVRAVITKWPEDKLLAITHFFALSYREPDSFWRIIPGLTVSTVILGPLGTAMLFLGGVLLDVLQKKVAKGDIDPNKKVGEVMEEGEAEEEPEGEEEEGEEEESEEKKASARKKAAATSARKFADNMKRFSQFFPK